MSGERFEYIVKRKGQTVGVFHHFEEADDYIMDDACMAAEFEWDNMTGTQQSKVKGGLGELQEEYMKAYEIEETAVPYYGWTQVEV